MVPYGSSKLWLLLFGDEMQRRMRAEGANVRVYACMLAGVTNAVVSALKCAHAADMCPC